MSNRRNKNNSNGENEGNGLGNLPSFVPPPPAMGRSGSSMMLPPPPAIGRSGSSMMPPPPTMERSGSSMMPPPPMFGIYVNTRPKEVIEAERVKRKKNTEDLLAAFPDPTEAISMVLSLDYFVILVDETRIPIDELFRYVTEHPETSLFRTLDDRLIIIVEAIQPNGEVYWRQAMYYSTGTSSGMRYTWFPFNGIFVRNRSYGKTKPIQLSLWFEKEFFNPSVTDERLIRNLTRFAHPNSPSDAVQYVYSGIGLPEGDFTYYTNNPEQQAEFDRFGSLSYFVASYKLGSKFFTNMMDTKLYTLTNTGPFSFTSYHPDKERYETILSFLEKKQYKNLDTLRGLIETPNVIDYAPLVKSIPIVKPNHINDMIDKFQASSIYNYFRNKPIHIPPYSAYSVFLPTLGYEMPKDEIFSRFHSYMRIIFIQSITDHLSNEQIQKEVDDTFSGILSEEEFPILKNSYNIEAIHPKNTSYLGGARKQTRRRVRKQSRRRRARKQSRRCGCGF